MGAPTGHDFSRRTGWLGSRTSPPVSLTQAGRSVALEDAGWVSEAPSVDLDRWRHLGTGLEAEVECRVFDDFPAIEWVPRLRNTGPTTSDLIEDWQSLDVSLLSHVDTLAINYALGSMQTVGDFAPQAAAVRAGDTLELQPGGGRSSSEVLPFMNVDLGGHGFVLGIGWTGEWRATFERDASGALRIRVGIDQTRFRLEPGESVRGPRILLLFWDGVARHGQNLLRRFLAAHHSPAADGRPVEPGLSACTWGGTPTTVHLASIDQIAHHGLPFEAYWIDAGWYGGDGEWWRNIGTWTVNPTLHPGGMAPALDHARRSGLRTVLWLEPERAARTSTWALEHPEWFLDVAADRVVECPTDRDDPQWALHSSRHTEIIGGELLFDLGNPAAREFLTDFISGRITAWGIDVYRQDFNIAPIEFWRSADTEDREGITQIRYIEGLYALWDELLRRHPGLAIDNCASGGRRIDLESLGRATPGTRSDLVDDPIGSQCHGAGLMSWLAYHTAGTHGGYDPYTLRSAWSLFLGVSWMVHFSQPETEPFPADFDFTALRANLAEYLEAREYFTGDFYPLTPYSADPGEWYGYQLNRPEIGDGIAVVFRRPDSRERRRVFRLDALDPGRHYTVEMAGVTTSHTGGSLMDDGLAVVLDDAPGSAVVRYRAEADAGHHREDPR